MGGWNDLTELPPNVVAATRRRVARVWVLVVARWAFVLAAVLFASVLAAVAAVVALVAAEALWGARLRLGGPRRSIRRRSSSA